MKASVPAPDKIYAMPRKRKRARRLQPALLLVAALLLAFVAWALLPRHSRHVATHEPAVPPPAVSTGSPAASPPAEIPASSPAAATPGPSPVLPPSSAPSPTAAPENANAPKVAIIIDDCGQWPAVERAYLALPIPLTLAVLPHVQYTGDIAKEAADAGKGVMLHLPMEPLSHIYPGPGEITTQMTDDEVTRQTEDDIAQVPLAKGMNNHEGSGASADARVMKDVVAVAKAHGLFFIDSRTNAKTVAASEAQDAGVPTASRDVFLDNTPELIATETMLERTATIALKNGSAIAIGHPKQTTLDALRLMYPKMLEEGVQFVLAQSLTH